MRRLLAPLACLLALMLVAGCGGAEPTAKKTPKPSTSPAVLSDQYTQLAAELKKRGVEVWFETDLVSAWLKGSGEFDRKLARLGALAKVSDVTGFKVADELGYNDGIRSAKQAQAFLTAAHDGLQRVAPGKEILIDLIVPQLGCLPGDSASGPADCTKRYAQKYPAITIDATTAFLRSGAVDRLDLSSGLQSESTYSSWKSSLADAQERAWARVVQLGWPTLTKLQARKAMAEVNGYQGNAGRAASEAATYIDIPRRHGAVATDIWTWRQPYKNGVASVLAPRQSTNPLWTELLKRKQAGAVLISHITPSQAPAGRAAQMEDLDKYAEVFDVAFVAAGAG